MTVIRPLLAGLATGARSFSAAAVCAGTTAGTHRVDRLLHSRVARRGIRRGAIVEVALDKLPVAPPRTEPRGLVARVALAAASGAVVASRRGEPAWRGAAIGVAGALPWTFAGPPVRAALARRSGSDLPGALGEDAVAYGLAYLAVRG
jgi:uncharacterized membrane protein